MAGNSLFRYFFSAIDTAQETAREREGIVQTAMEQMHENMRACAEVNREYKSYLMGVREVEASIQRPVGLVILMLQKDETMSIIVRMFGVAMPAGRPDPIKPGEYKIPRASLESNLAQGVHIVDYSTMYVVQTPVSVIAGALYAIPTHKSN